MADQVTIRTMGPEEWRTVRDVRLRALADAPTAFASSYEREAAFGEAEWVDRLTSGSATFCAFLPEFGPEAVGLSGGLPGREIPDQVELISMWVDPRVRGKGAGELLVEAVAGWAGDHGAAFVHLWVVADNDRARRFYTRCGFEFTGEEQVLPSIPHAPEHGMRLRVGR